MDFADIQKMFDPKKIVEAQFGQLGGLFGTPFGIAGSFAEYSPKKYFDSDSYYNAEGYYDAKSVLREALAR